MTDNLEELERLLAKATPGEWSTDTLKSEGEYGSGPDTNIGFKVTAIYDDAGRALFDPLNSDAILVEEDYGDEDGNVLAYDAVSANNAALIVALKNSAPSLIATAREVEGLRSVLSGLSSYLGAGLGDEATTPEQFDQRIRWGIEHQASAYRDRAASIVEECSKRPGTTWGEVKSAIQNDTFFPEPDNSEVEGLRAEVARVTGLARANNDLARIEVAYRKQLAFERAEMANALEAVTSQYGDLLPAEFLADLTAMLMRPALRAGAALEGKGG